MRSVGAAARASQEKIIEFRRHAASLAHARKASSLPPRATALCLPSPVACSRSDVSGQTMNTEPAPTTCREEWTDVEQGRKEGGVEGRWTEAWNRRA